MAVPPTLPDRSVSRSPSTDEFDVAHWSQVEPKTDVNEVSKACHAILATKKKIEESTGFRRNNFFNALAITLVGLDSLESLEENAKREMVFLLTAAYRALDQLQTIKGIDSNLASVIKMKQNFMQMQCYGLGPQLCLLTSLLQVGQAIGESYVPEIFALGVTADGKDLTLIEHKNANSEQQQKVYEKMSSVVTCLKNDSVVKHFSVQQLLYMKMAICNFMVNYVLFQPKELDCTEQIFVELKEAHRLVNGILAQRSPEEFKAVRYDSILQRLSLIKATLVSQLYYEDFWTNPKHVQELKAYNEMMNSCCQFIKDPPSINISGLVSLGLNPLAGLVLYKLPQDDPKAPSVLVVFSYNKEGVLPYWNFLQSRKSELGFGGLGHAPVYERAESCWNALPSLIEEAVKEGKISPTCSKLITAGFGIDGAVAQLLAFLFAKENPQVETRTYMMGTAPFVDVNAAATIKQRSNHFALNFVLHRDTNLKQSAFGDFVRKAYSEWNVQKFTLYNRNWFLSDVTGHDKNIYIGNVETGVQQPVDLYDLHSDIVKFLEILETKKNLELSEALCQHCVSYRNQKN